MAFDWTKLEGYREDMSAEEKIALMENYEEPKPEEPKPDAMPKNAVSKAMFDKVSSELASVKKQLRGKMSEEEQKEIDRQTEREAMETELKELRREKSLSGYKANYLSQGYDETLAEEAATAMVDGDMDTVFAVMRKFNSANEKTLRAKILKETPMPPAGDSPDDEAKKAAEDKKLRGYFGLR